jgi:Flp pilus assembly protein TadB
MYSQRLAAETAHPEQKWRNQMIKKVVAIISIGIIYALSAGSCAILIIKGTQNPLVVFKGFVIFIIALLLVLIVAFFRTKRLNRQY